jgi:hypothetical protein
MPLIVVALVAAVLKLTHHTAVPPMQLPVRPSSTHTPALNFKPSTAQINACEGKVPGRISGIAVQHQPAAELADYKKSFPAAQLQIVEFYNAFRKPFGRAEAEQAVEAGMIPFIQLNPRGVSEQKIASGKWDQHLRNYADAIKAFQCTVILSFGHEMNGWWYPWGREPAPKPSTSPAAFKEAWQHIHDIFSGEGVTNVIWSWDPSHQHGEVGLGKIGTPASEWYPGNKYVDWIGLDGYLGYDHNGHVQSFSEIFGYQLRDIRKKAPGKPVYLAETGVRSGSALASQMAALFSGIEANHLMGLVWFDANAKNDYRLGIHKDLDAAYLRNVTDFLKTAPAN